MTQSAETLNSGDPKLRVLVVDNDQAPRKRRAEQLESWGYIPVLAEGVGAALLLDAEQKAGTNRCQIALVDMRLLDDQDSSDFSGLQLVKRLKPTISIIVSGFGDERSVRAAWKDHEAFDFVGKQHGPKAIQAALDDLEQKYAIGRYRPRIVWSRGLDSTKIRDLLFPKQPDIPADEADDLIGRVFHTTNNHGQNRIQLTMIEDETEAPITDTPQSSRQGSTLRRESRIFRVIVNGQPALQVVKLARPERINQEVANYEEYVEFGLRGMYRPEMSGHDALWDMGAVVYRHIGGTDELLTFTRYYRRTNDILQIVQPLHHFFDISWGHFYGRRQSLESQSLFAAYDTAWHEALSDALPSWRIENKKRAFPQLLVEMPNPARWLHDHASESDDVFLPQEAVTHGDLHGDNLFVNSQHAWSIDFERTGYGPILRDFIELLQDMTTRIAKFEDHDLPVIYELAVSICAPSNPGELLRPTTAILRHAEACKVFHVVQALLQMAHTRAQHHDQRELLWGLLFNHMFVATRLTTESPRWLRTLLFASVICGRLEAWGSPTWPPSNWSQVDWEPAADANRKSHSVPFDDEPLLDRIANATGAGFAHGYALLVGVGKTQYVPGLSLPVTVNDAKAVYRALIDPGRCAYPDVQTRLLCNDTATGAEIRAGLSWLAEQVRHDSQATAIVYFSGHGWCTDDGRYALVPSDVRLQNIEQTLLWAEEFTGALRAINARRLLVLTDACHAAGMGNAKDMDTPPGFSKAAPPPDLFQALEQGEGRVVISSSRGKQLSYFRPDRGLSIFTDHLLEALRGVASRPGDTVVKVSDLVYHLGKQVPRTARDVFAAQQEPWTDQSAVDFPVALLLGGQGLTPKES